MNGWRPTATPPNWWERAIDHFIHGELLFLKLPILFATPRLERRSRWPDDQTGDAGRVDDALAAMG